MCFVILQIHHFDGSALCIDWHQCRHAPSSTSIQASAARRHLNESQCGMVAAKIANLAHGRISDFPSF